MLVEVEVERLGDGLGRDLGGVAGENDDMVVGRERGLRNHEGVAGAALLGLPDEVDAGVGEGVADAIGFVADDGKDVAGGNDVGGRGDNVGQQGVAANFLQDFRKLRLQAGAFSGGHDGDGYAGDRGRRSFRRLWVYGFLHSPNYTLSRNCKGEGYGTPAQASGQAAETES